MTDIDAIDRAIREAQTRAELGEEPLSQPPSHLSVENSSDGRQLKSVEREQERARRRAEREARKIEREKNRRTPHMAKAEKVINKLPPLPENLKVIFDHLMNSGHSQVHLELLADHLKAYSRLERTKAAVAADDGLKLGSDVVVIGGDPKFIGRTGQISNIKRIRCHVRLPDQERELYLFRSDVKLVSNAQEIVNNTDEIIATGT